MRVPAQALAALFPTHRAAEDGPHTWALHPVGDLEQAPSSLAWPGPAAAAVWGVNWHMRDLCLPLPATLPCT